jgi:hypothetical protein
MWKASLTSEGDPVTEATADSPERAVLELVKQLIETGSPDSEFLTVAGTLLQSVEESEWPRDQSLVLEETGGDFSGGFFRLKVEFAE